MAAPTETYVDPGATIDTGTGSKGSPYGPRTGGKAATQHALDTITQGAGGDRINVKAGTDDTLDAALTLATYGTTTSEKPLIIQGYTTDEDDFGVGGIDGAATFSIYSAAGNYISFVDMHLHNCGSNKILLLNDECGIIRCEIDGSTGYGIECDEGNLIYGCNIHDCAGILIDTGTHVISNYIVGDSASFSVAIQTGNNNCIVEENIITQIAGSDTGIYLLGAKHTVRHNSLLGSSSTGIAIRAFSNVRMSMVSGNLIGGFDGAGGDGIDMSQMSQRILLDCSYNAVEATTEYNLPDHVNTVIDNETLGASPFDESGSDTFSNRFIFFNPVDTGNIRGGMPNGRDKGAVESSAGGGGGDPGGSKGCGPGGGFVA